MLPEIIEGLIDQFNNKSQLTCRDESKLIDYIVAFANSGGGVISFKCERGYYFDRSAIDPPLEISTFNQGDLFYIVVPDGPLKPYSTGGKILLFANGKLKIPTREDIVSLVKTPMRDVTAETIPNVGSEFFNQELISILKNSLEKIWGIGISNIFEQSGLIKNGKPTKTLILLAGKRPDLFINGAYIVLRSPSGEIDKLTGSIPELIEKTSQLVLSKLVEVHIYQSLNINHFRDCLKIIINEIIANALIHRDYTIPLPVTLSYLEKEISVWNPGIPIGENDVPRPFLVYVRNPFLYRFAGMMGIIKSSGAGVSEINKKALLCNINPIIFEKYQGGIFTKIVLKSSIQSRRLNERERKLLDYIKNTGYITRKDYEKLMGVSERTARLDLGNLVKRGILKKVGKGKNTVYELVP